MEEVLKIELINQGRDWLDFGPLVVGLLAVWIAWLQMSKASAAHLETARLNNEQHEQTLRDNNQRHLELIQTELIHKERQRILDNLRRESAQLVYALQKLDHEIVSLGFGYGASLESLQEAQEQVHRFAFPIVWLSQIVEFEQIKRSLDELLVLVMSEPASLLENHVRLREVRTRTLTVIRDTLIAETRRLNDAYSERS